MPRIRRRSLILTATLATTAAAALVAFVVDAVPSSAATCNGYVGLTFDDGPTPGNTQNLLNALRQNGLRATFFNEGQYASSNPSLVAAQVAGGNWVGNHSWDHPHMTQQSQATMDSQISRTQQAISNAGGGTPKLFRPPYGETNATLKSVEQKYGLTEIIWDVDSQDWNNASVDAIVQANGRLTNGQVILMHDWPANTVAAIPRIAQGLTSRNLCPGMISPQTGRAVAPDGGQQSSSSSSRSSSSSSRPSSSSSSRSSSSSSSSQGGTGGPCRVSAIVSAWNTGLTESVTITNTGTSAINGWRLTFTLPSGQTITSGWNATYSPTSGAVTATNASYNGTINANASVNIGFQANHTGNTAAASGFALNGAACTS